MVSSSFQIEDSEATHFLDSHDPLDSFLFSLRAKETIRQYPRRLKIFFNSGLDPSLSLKEQSIIFYNKSKENANWTFLYFKKFIELQKSRVIKGEITGTTIHYYYKVAKLFCKMNDIVINWDRLSKALPPQKHHADDRGPTIEELKRLLEDPDKRIKPLVLTMLSSGIRLGAWEYLRVKDVIPIKDKKSVDIIAGKIIVYGGEHDQYVSLITPEAWFAVEEWINYRKQHGEKITPDSMLMRDIWQTSERSYGAYFGLAKNPKKLKIGGIKSLIERAIRSQGLLISSSNHDFLEFDEKEPIYKKGGGGRKMRPWKSIHGIRKTFKLITEQKMKPANIEILLGHKLGISSSYYKPNLERDILPDYLQVVDDLTINDEYRISKQIVELQEKNRNKDYLIQDKLQEKDDQIEEIRKQMKEVQKEMEYQRQILINAAELKDKRYNELLKNPEEIIKENEIEKQRVHQTGPHPFKIEEHDIFEPSPISDEEIPILLASEILKIDEVAKNKKIFDGIMKSAKDGLAEFKTKFSSS